MVLCNIVWCVVKGGLSLSLKKKTVRTAPFPTVRHFVYGRLFSFEKRYISPLYSYDVCVCSFSFYVTSQQQQQHHHHQRFLLGWTRLVQLSDTHGMCATRIFYFILSISSSSSSCYLSEREKIEFIFFYFYFLFFKNSLSYLVTLCMGFTYSLTRCIACKIFT